VNTPGIHQLQGRKTLIEILSMAGGLRPDAGHVAVITRRAEWGPIPVPNATKDPSGGFTSAEIDLSAVTEAESPARNIAIRPHDIISIPKARLVYVIGEVERAGGFPLQDQEGMSLLQALSLAGGCKGSASPKNARILKPKGAGLERQEIAVNLKAVLSGQAKDRVLGPDEILFVPDNVPRKAGVRAAEAALQAVTGVVIWRGGAR
jgi:polysaccharide export outer membrane protein